MTNTVFLSCLLFLFSRLLPSFLLIGRMKGDQRWHTIYGIASGVLGVVACRLLVLDVYAGFLISALRSEWHHLRTKIRVRCHSLCELETGGRQTVKAGGWRDGSCPFCNAGVRAGGSLDWLC